jgi:hypothetical protein
MLGFLRQTLLPYGGKAVIRAGSPTYTFCISFGGDRDASNRGFGGYLWKKHTCTHRYVELIGSTCSERG